MEDVLCSTRFASVKIEPSQREHAEEKVARKSENLNMDVASAPLRNSGRRHWIKDAATLISGATAAAMLVPTVAEADANRIVPAQANAKTHLIANDENAIVETTAGKVRGYTRNGIQTFKGIPYAASTEGKARYQPPAKPTPWTGVRSSMQYGYVCPQASRAGWANDEE